MKPSKFTELQEARIQNKGLVFLTDNSRKWYQRQVQNLRNSDGRLSREIVLERGTKVPNFRPGKLFMFFYDAKTKDDLPYWDKFPLILLLDKDPDGFTGLNLHYLPPQMRRMFLVKLMKYAIREEDEIHRIRISYEILNAARNLKEFRPCIKRYLRSHIKSKMVEIQANEWETAIYLPTQMFQKEKAQNVWKDSIQEVKDSLRSTSSGRDAEKDK